MDLVTTVFYAAGNAIAWLLMTAAAVGGVLVLAAFLLRAFARGLQLSLERAWEAEIIYRVAAMLWHTTKLKSPRGMRPRNYGPHPIPYLVWCMSKTECLAPAVAETTPAIDDPSECWPSWEDL